MRKRGAIYTRVSTTRQEQGHSPEGQEADCRAYAAENGIDIVAVFHDAHSGDDVWTRPEVSKLRAAFRANDFEVLLFDRLDRLSRRQIHQGLVLSEAELAGIDWVSVKEPYINETPEGSLLRGIIGGMAEYGRHQHIARTQEGMRRRIEKGLPRVGAAPMYGYRWIEEEGGTLKRRTKVRLEPNPDTSLVVRRIFAEALGGATTGRIADGLEADGIPTPSSYNGLNRSSSGKWSRSTVHGILMRRAYTGEAIASQTIIERVGREKKRRKRTEDEGATPLPEGVVPRLIEPEVFEAVQARVSRNKETMSGRRQHDPEDGLLRRGFAVCGHCGNNLVVYFNRLRSHYRCEAGSTKRHDCPQASIMTVTLDNAVWSQVENVLNNPDVIARKLAEMETEDPTAHDLSSVERQIGEVERKQRNLVSRLAGTDDEAVAKLVDAEIKKLSSQRRQWEEERALLAAQSELRRQARDRIADIDAMCRDMAANLSELTYDQKRLLLDALGCEVKLYPTSHEQRYEITFGFDVEGNPTKQLLGTC